MKIFFQNKDESISFCETGIPDISIDSDIYVLSNYLFFKSKDDIVVMKNGILLHLDDYRHSLTKVLYNETLKMIAIMDSKSRLQLLLEINDSKMKIKSIQFSELIISEDFANPYEYCYRYTDKLEILHKGNNYIFESFDYSNSDTENNKAIEVKKSDKLDANISLLFNLSTEFGYSIVCKKQDNVLYLIDDKKQIINSHKNLDFVIKKYSINKQRNLLTTISIQNNFYVWNILKEGLKLWTDGKLPSELFLQDMSFSENGKFIGILTKQEDELSELVIFEIVKKKQKHKLKLVSNNNTSANKVNISDFGYEVKDSLPETNTANNESNCGKETTISKVQVVDIGVETNANKHNYDNQPNNKPPANSINKAKQVEELLSKSSDSEQEVSDNRPELSPKIRIKKETIFQNNYKLPKERANVDSIETYIGIDIGTKYSKVVIEIESSKQRYTFPLKNDKGELFHLTEVYIADDIIFFDKEKAKTRSSNWEKVDYLKLRFADDPKVRMLLIAYIMNIVNESKVYAYNWIKTTELKLYNLDFFIAISFPETLYIDQTKSRNFDSFKRVVATAESLLNKSDKTEYTLEQLSEEFDKSKYCEETNMIAVVPESISEIFSFLEVIKDYGQIVLIDIGEGTTELSGCWIDQLEKNKITVWHSHVMYKGAYDYKRDNSDYKLALKRELQNLMENKRAFYEVGECSNSGKVYVGGGGCKIEDIVSELKIIKANNKTIKLKIKSLSEPKYCKSEHLFSHDVLMNYHRFLVSIGSIKYYKYEDDYQINKQSVDEEPNTRIKESWQEILEERMRNNGLW